MVAVRSHDPLRNFQFRLRLLPNRSTEDQAGGAASGYIAGVTRISGLSATITPVEIWSGGNARHRYAHPDKCTWEPITLDQGLALDGTLADWADAAIRFATTGVAGASPVKRGLSLDVWDPYATMPPRDGLGNGGDPGAPPAHPMYRYVIHNAWISRYQAMPSLDAMANEVAFLSVEITHEGWRAETVTPETELLNDDSILTEPGGTDLVPPSGSNETRFA